MDIVSYWRLVFWFGIAVGLLIWVLTKRFPLVVLGVALLAYSIFITVYDRNYLMPWFWLAALLWLIIVQPLLVRATYRLPESLLIDAPDDQARTLGNSSVLNALAAKLPELGFRYSGRLFLWCGREKSAIRYFCDATGTIVAQVHLHARGLAGFQLLSTQDGRRVISSNWPSMRPWKPPAGWVYFYHHFAKAPHELLALHRQHLDELGFHSPAPLDPGTLTARAQEAFEADMQEGVRRGHIIHLPGIGYRLTFVGVLRVFLFALLHHYRHENYRIG